MASSGNSSRSYRALALLLCATWLPPLLPSMAAQSLDSAAIPAHEAPIILFNGSDLSQFDTFIRGRGLNNDPEHVFQVENGVIHVFRS